MGGKRNIIHSPFKYKVDYKGCVNLPTLLLKIAREHAENGKTEWMTDSLTEESFDFSRFDDLTSRVASAFFKRGLRKGDIVIFMQIDIVKQPIFLTGVWRANGICRATYPEENEETLFQRVQESRAGWIYCEPFHAEMCLRVAERIYWDVEVILTASPGENLQPGCTSIYELFDDDGSEIPESDTTFKDTALIMCTSGTTGNSKGAVLTQSAMLWQFTASACIFPEDDGEKVNLVFTKCTHISGMIIPFGSLINGAATHYLTFISRENILRVVGKYKPRSIFGFPTFLLLLVNDPAAKNLDLTNLEYVMGAGAAITPAAEQALMTLPSLKGVINVYGLTECAPAIITNDPDVRRPILNRPEGSIGMLCAGASAQFLDEETGKAVGVGEIGELCIACSGLFKSYYLNPKASKAAFTEPPCFFKTGDIGYHDDNGFIYLVDRAKDMFKYLGNHVSPTEIENVILAHPDIGEVCVIAIPDPDGAGYIPRAFCVKASHLDDEEEVTAKDILDYANEKLAVYKHLRGGVYFVKELPKGKTGKVTRQLVEKIDVNALD